MADAGLQLAQETATALEEYYIGLNEEWLHRGLITAIMDFNQRWETWIDKLGPGDLKHPASKVFHQFLLRFTKGSVKAYRCWRIDRLKEES